MRQGRKVVVLKYRLHKVVTRAFFLGGLITGARIERVVIKMDHYDMYFTNLCLPHLIYQIFLLEDTVGSLCTYFVWICSEHLVLKHALTMYKTISPVMTLLFFVYNWSSMLILLLIFALSATLFLIFVSVVCNNSLITKNEFNAAERKGPSLQVQ